MYEAQFAQAASAGTAPPAQPFTSEVYDRLQRLYSRLDDADANLRALGDRLFGAAPENAKTGGQNAAAQGCIASAFDELLSALSVKAANVAERAALLNGRV
jgi:hypothetical protein